MRHRDSGMPDQFHVGDFGADSNSSIHGSKCGQKTYINAISLDAYSLDSEYYFIFTV